MRGSPIRNLSSTSPFKASILRSQRRDILEGSPDKMNSNFNQIQYWRSKARQFEAQFKAVSDDLLMNSRRFQRVQELEDKIETLLRQNNHLVEQNETLLQVIQQKKTENDALRHQLDAGGMVLERQTRRAHSNINIIDEEHRIQIQKLLLEINRLQDYIEETQTLKKIQIDGIRSKFESEAIQQIQNLRRSQQGNSELLELNIRNLRDTIEEKNLEIERLKKEMKLEGERATGEVSFLKNQIKKTEKQKQNQFELYQAEHQNNIGNLKRTHGKNQDQMKNLYQNKIRRLGYEIEEKKNEIEENLTRFRRSGKESEQEVAILLEDKSQLRRDLKDLDALRLRQLEDMTNFYDNELRTQKDNGQAKEANTKELLQDEIHKLRRIIEAKQAENTSLMNQIRTIKQNEQLKITNLSNQKDELENKFREMVLHYQREIQLLKIKTSKLYEADLQALRQQLQNQLSLLASENGRIKESLTESRDHLISELEQKVTMRRDYETRLREMNLKYEREHQQLHDLILMAEKKFQNAQSQTSIRDIEHTSKIKRTNTNIQGIFAEKRNLQNQISSKSKEIEALNLRIQKMQGYHQKQLSDLEKRNEEEKEKYNQSLNTQNSLLKAQVQHQEDLEKNYRLIQDKLKEKQKQLNDKLNAKNRELDEKGLRIAKLEGMVQEMEKHHGVLDSKIKVQVGNIERTNLELTALMNDEKDKLQKIRESDKSGIKKDYDHRLGELRKEINDLNSLVQNLRASYQAEKVKSRSLEKELSDNLKRLDEKGILQEHVINIGLSNNYFKNIAQIFRKQV